MSVLLLGGLDPDAFQHSRPVSSLKTLPSWMPVILILCLRSVQPGRVPAGRHQNRPDVCIKFKWKLEQQENPNGDIDSDPNLCVDTLLAKGRGGGGHTTHFFNAPSRILQCCCVQNIYRKAVVHVRRAPWRAAQRDRADSSAPGRRRPHIRILRCPWWKKIGRANSQQHPESHWTLLNNDTTVRAHEAWDHGQKTKQKTRTSGWECSPSLSVGGWKSLIDKWSHMEA